MRVCVNIDTKGKGSAETIADGAGELAADLLREVAKSAEVGGMVSGPLWDRNADPPHRIGSYSFEVSREAT